MKKYILFLSVVLCTLGFTFASESFPAFPMTIYGNTNLAWWTIKVYDWLNQEISSYDITTSGKYWSENAFVLPLSLNDFDGGLSFKAIYNWQEYTLQSIDDSNRGLWCPSKNSITFVSENCRYDLTFQSEWRNDTWTSIWVKLKKDKCPGWDFSDSYYDWTCGSNSKRSHNSADEWDLKEILSNWYTREMNNAYEFAYQKWITTKKSINQANMYWKLNRISMAKMLSQYAINILWQKPDTNKIPNFGDVSQNLDKEYNNGVTLAYQLWIMWVSMENFRPFDEVPRSEFVTALSRMLYWLEDWTVNYYSTHMEKLEKEWIITNTNPKLIELRWYIMLMLMRSAE